MNSPLVSGGRRVPYPPSSTPCVKGAFDVPGIPLHSSLEPLRSDVREQIAAVIPGRRQPVQRHFVVGRGESLMQGLVALR